MLTVWLVWLACLSKDDTKLPLIRRVMMQTIVHNCSSFFSWNKKGNKYPFPRGEENNRRTGTKGHQVHITVWTANVIPTEIVRTMIRFDFPNHASHKLRQGGRPFCGVLSTNSTSWIYMFTFVYFMWPTTKLSIHCLSILTQWTDELDLSYQLAAGIHLGNLSCKPSYLHLKLPRYLSMSVGRYHRVVARKFKPLLCL